MGFIHFEKGNTNGFDRQSKFSPNRACSIGFPASREQKYERVWQTKSSFDVIIPMIPMIPRNPIIPMIPMIPMIS